MLNLRKVNDFVSGLWLILIITVFLLFAAGCGGVGVSVTEPPPLTLAPLPTSVVGGDCTLTSDLETWLQRVSLRHQEFLELIADAGDKTPQQLFAVVQRMYSLAQVIRANPVVDCGQEAQETLLEAMTGAIVLFQPYVNGERDDLDVIIAESQAGFTEATAMLDALLERLLAQYDAPGQG